MGREMRRHGAGPARIAERWTRDDRRGVARAAPGVLGPGSRPESAACGFPAPLRSRRPATLQRIRTVLRLRLRILRRPDGPACQPPIQVPAARGDPPADLDVRRPATLAPPNAPTWKGGRAAAAPDHRRSKACRRRTLLTSGRDTEGQVCRWRAKLTPEPLQRSSRPPSRHRPPAARSPLARRASSRTAPPSPWSCDRAGLAPRTR